MTWASRLALGASLSALLTLIADPISRPYLIGILSGPSARSLKRFDARVRELTPPTSVREAARWTQVAAEKMDSSHALTGNELKSLQSVIDEARAKDPKNAYWPQMDAVVEYRRGDERAAETSWVQGSKCLLWNDYQSELLNDESEQLARTTHERQGWEYAYTYRKRSAAAAELIEKLARKVVSMTDLVSDRSLTLRYATVANGALLRDGSRNVFIGQIGASIVEVGAYPPDLASRRSPKRLLLGENDLFNNLTKLGKTDWASYVQEQFGRNEAWQALSTMERAEDQARQLGVMALVLAVLPGAVLAVGLVGSAIWGFGALCERAFQGKGFGWIFPIICGLTLGALVYLLTSFIVAATASTLCGLFLLVTPSKQRSARRRDFGPTFGLAIGVLATAAGMSLGAFLVWGSGPAVSMLPSLSVPSEYFGGSPLFIGLAVLFFSMVFLVTPFWSMAQHMPTPFVFAQGMKLFGTTLSISALCLIVFAGPLVIYADQRTSQTLRALLLNEPVYYHLKYGPGS
jgi:hypothetical protein